MSSSVLFYPHEPNEPNRPRPMLAEEVSEECVETRGCLTRLIENWVVLPEEWDELSPDLRSTILKPSNCDILDRLVENHLLTRFQANKVREGGEAGGGVDGRKVV